MPAFSRQFHDRFGDEATIELANWLNSQEEASRREMRDLVETQHSRFDRVLTRLSGLEGALRGESVNQGAAIRVEVANLNTILRAEMAGLAERLSGVELRLLQLEARFDPAVATIDARFDAAEAKIDARFEAADANIDARFDAADAKIDARFEAADANIDARFAAEREYLTMFVTSAIAASEARMSWRMFGFMIGSVLTMLAGIVGLSRLGWM